MTLILALLAFAIYVLLSIALLRSNGKDEESERKAELMRVGGTIDQPKEDEK